MSDTSYLVNFIIKDIQHDQIKEIIINCLEKGINWRKLAYQIQFIC